MNTDKIALFCLCLVLSSASFGNGTKSQTKNNSEEVTSGEHSSSKQSKCGDDEKDCDIDYVNSNETGPLDSHEAMNTRELKARNKRSTEVDKKAFRNMLLGLVHKKSQDMKAGALNSLDGEEDADDIGEDQQKFQSDASELLLELMVRIAAHPQQWNEVHELLQRIDTDIVTSQKILSDTSSTMKTITEPPTTESSAPATTTEIDEVQKLIVLLDNEQKYSQRKNDSRNAWPNLGDEEFSPEKTATTQNIFSSWVANKSVPKNATSRDFEFAYHRVTGLPLPYRSNYDKGRVRNAYVAVSVIAPKTRESLDKQDNLLEEELRQLKPWTHEENLSKMENIRKKWFIRSDTPDKRQNLETDI